MHAPEPSLADSAAQQSAASSAIRADAALKARPLAADSEPSAETSSAEPKISATHNIIAVTSPHPTEHPWLK